MEDISTFWLLFFISLLLLALLVKHFKKRKNNISTIEYSSVDEYEDDYVDDNNIDYINQENYYPYHKKYLLTKHEYYFFKNLYKAIEPYNLSIMAKIRLADLVEVNSNVGKKYMSYFGKIKSKHIDFALVIPEKMEIKYLIELDDSSHEAQKRIDRDIFVNNLLSATGYTLLRTYGDLSEIIKTIESDETIKKKEEINKAPETNLTKVIADLYVKIGNIERMISDVDDTPYIIENKEEDS